VPVQDQAFSHGPGESRFVEEKRHFEKPIPISSLVYLDRERCILCDPLHPASPPSVAGDPLISFTSRATRRQVQPSRTSRSPSYFSGNTVQICPVGALTAKPYRFKARPWDLEQAESTCTTCSVGCRITVQSSRNQVLRYQGVDSDPVNWGWLCDKGRFAFEAVPRPSG
jgi:NADH-quinone oxidoreductase subunit G